MSFVDLLIVCITLFSTPLRGIRLSLCPSLSDHYIKSLGWIGAVAMLIVGGSIIIHNITYLHGLIHLGSELPSIMPFVLEFFVVPVGVSILVGSALVLLINRFKG